MTMSTPLPISTPAPCAVWRIDLDQPVSPAAAALLSQAESARALRFVFARDRTRFVAAHAALRELLERRTGRPGERLHLVEGPSGKPALPGAGFHFNLSHSQDIGVVALSDDVEVGIDVEVLRPMPDAREMASAYFTPSEQTALATLMASDPRAAERAFFICWTRKEACVKALGVGLQLSTAGFDVGVDDLAGQVQTLDVVMSYGTESIQLQSFSCGAKAVGALAMRLVPAHVSPLPCDGTHALSKAFA